MHLYPRMRSFDKLPIVVKARAFAIVRAPGARSTQVALFAIALASL